MFWILNLQSWTKVLGHFRVSGAFSNSHRSNPSPHPTNGVARVYPEFFPSFNFVSCGGEGELQENFEKYALLWEGTEKWQKNMNFAVLSQGVLSRIVGLSPCQENQITLRGTGHTAELVRGHSRPQSPLA